MTTRGTEAVIPTGSQPEQLDFQELPSIQFIQALERVQEHIVSVIPDMDLPHKIGDRAYREYLIAETRVYNRFEEELKDSKGNPISDRITILSESEMTYVDQPSGVYVSFIDYETVSPDKIRAGMVRLGDSSSVFGFNISVVRKTIDKIINPTTSWEIPISEREVLLIGESEYNYEAFTGLFKDSIYKALKRLEEARKLKEEIEAKISKRKSELEKSSPQQSFTRAMVIFGEHVVEPAQIVEPTPPPVESPQPPAKLTG